MKSHNKRKGQKAHNKRKVHRKPNHSRMPYEAVVPRQFGPFAGQTIVKQRYVEHFTFSGIAAGAAALNYFNLNSVFNPVSGGSSKTNKPYGYDQLEGLYNRYRVFKTRFRFKLQSTTSSEYYFGMVPINGTFPYSVSTETAWEQFCTTPRVKTCILGANQKILSSSQNLWALDTTKKSAYMTDDRYSAQFNASPAEIIRVYFVFFNAGTSTAAITFNFEIEYDVLWYDPNTQDGSTFRYLRVIAESPEIKSLLDQIMEKKH
jgi:hypothetical protein